MTFVSVNSWGVSLCKLRDCVSLTDLYYVYRVVGNAKNCGRFSDLEVSIKRVLVLHVDAT